MEKKEFYSLTDSLKNETELRAEVVSLTALSEALKAKAAELETEIDQKLSAAPADGKAYIQKDGQWQEIDPLSDRVATIANPNLLINGDFSVWQRGNTFNGSYAYAADRWILSTMAGSGSLNFGNHEVVTNYPISKSNTAAILVPNGAGHEFLLRQVIEKGITVCNNQPVTLSFDVSDRMGLYSELIVDLCDLNAARIPLTSGWQRVTVTFPATDLSSMKDTLGINGNHLFLDFKGVSLKAGEIASGLHITDVKLEIGPHATPFIPDDPATNLAKCQRYYSNTYRPQWGSRYTSDGFLQLQDSFPVTMRTVPTLTLNYRSPFEPDYFVVTNSGFVSHYYSQSMIAIHGFVADAEL